MKRGAALSKHRTRFHLEPRGCTRTARENAVFDGHPGAKDPNAVKCADCVKDGQNKAGNATAATNPIELVRHGVKLKAAMLCSSGRCRLLVCGSLSWRGSRSGGAGFTSGLRLGVNNNRCHFNLWLVLFTRHDDEGSETRRRRRKRRILLLMLFCCCYGDAVSESMIFLSFCLPVLLTHEKYPSEVGGSME